jgi:hypothetical protein|tara:strand:+ start:33420 stop:33893 length:474 start_codon:yes stop_codon:yes gene_type:complete
MTHTTTETTSHFTLPRSIHNPEPDRRTKRNWTKGEFLPAGLYELRTVHHTITHGGKTVEIDKPELRYVGTHTDARYHLTADDGPRWHELMHSLVPVLRDGEPTPEALTILARDEQVDHAEDFIAILSRVAIRGSLRSDEVASIVSEYMTEAYERDAN